MNNNNIVKIGTALKWRSTFDINKRYYQENIVTMCGCVFRCKILLAQGKPPVAISDESGHIVYANPDVWDVVIDMANYYNFVIDEKYLVEKIDKQVQENTGQIQIHRKEIDAIKLGDLQQWEAIDNIAYDLQQQINNIVGNSTTNIAAIEKYIKEHGEEHFLIDEKFEKLLENIERIDEVNKVQQDQIDYWFDNNSAYTSGIWDNDILWVNHLYWDNGPGSSNDCTLCNERFANIERALSELTIKYNEQQTIIDKQQQQIEKLLSAVTISLIKSYDEGTGTIYFADYVEAENYSDELEEVTFTDSISVSEYDEKTEKVYII